MLDIRELRGTSGYRSKEPFSNHALRWESFKKFAGKNMVIALICLSFLFKNFQIIVHCFPDYVKTRWLSLGRLIDEILRIWHATAFLEEDIEKKWFHIFEHYNFVLLREIVSALLSIFPSNAFCESAFSVFKKVRTDERNLMRIKLLSSLVSINFDQSNTNFNCPDAFKYFPSHTDLLKKVLSSEKYDKQLFKYLFS